MQIDELQRCVLNALEDIKAQDILVMDVRGKTSVTDFMVIASGTSSRHLRSCIEKVTEEVKARGLQPLSVEGKDQSDWVLVDLGDLIVHVLLPEAREFYALEELWQVA